MADESNLSQVFGSGPTVQAELVLIFPGKCSSKSYDLIFRASFLGSKYLNSSLCQTESYNTNRNLSIWLQHHRWDEPRGPAVDGSQMFENSCITLSKLRHQSDEELCSLTLHNTFCTVVICCHFVRRCEDLKQNVSVSLWMCENDRLSFSFFPWLSVKRVCLTWCLLYVLGIKVFFSPFTGEGPVWNTESLSSFPVGLYVQNSDPHLEKHLLQNICSMLRRRQVMTLDPDVVELSCVVVFS